MGQHSTYQPVAQPRQEKKTHIHRCGRFHTYGNVTALNGRPDGTCWLRRRTVAAAIPEPSATQVSNVDAKWKTQDMTLETNAVSA